MLKIFLLKRLNIFLFTVLLFSQHSLLAQDRLLYVLSKAGHQIHTINLTDPTSPETVLPKNKDFLSNPYAFLHDPLSDELYWVDARAKMLLNGGSQDSSSSSQVLNQIEGPVDLALNPISRQLYLLDHLGSKIYQQSIDGGTAQLLVSDSLARPTSMALSLLSNRIYWADMKLKKIFSCALDGSDAQEFFKPQQGYAVQLAISDLRNELYWSDDLNHTISSIKLDGSEERLLYQGENNESPYGLFIDESEGDLYWTDYKQGTVSRLGLVDLQVEQLADNLSEPLDLLILDRMPERQIRQSNEQQSNSQFTRFEVYPNPSKDHLMVSVAAKTGSDAMVNIYDREGRLVQTSPLQSSNMRLDISDLPAGWYLCRLESENVQLQKSFVVLP